MESVILFYTRNDAIVNESVQKKTYGLVLLAHKIEMKIYPCQNLMTVSWIVILVFFFGRHLDWLELIAFEMSKQLLPAIISHKASQI